MKSVRGKRNLSVLQAESENESVMLALTFERSSMTTIVRSIPLTVFVLLAVADAQGHMGRGQGWHMFGGLALIQKTTRCGDAFCWEKQRFLNLSETSF